MKYKTKTKDQPFNNTTEIQQLYAQTDQYHNLASQVLELLNQTDTRIDLIKEILFLVKVVTRYEAVGIRLRDGEDFPYYETIGFSKDFVTSERYLCARDQAGELIRDSEGNPYLECMCGNVICGRTDPSLPFFTEGGSFWTNSTTELLATTTEEDRHGSSRNRCNGEGYESVALIPLRYDKKIIGLLQLNDSRKNLFTANLIRFFEGVVSSIAIAFKIKQSENTLLPSRLRFDTIDGTALALHHENCNYCNLFRNSPISIWEEDFSAVKTHLDYLKKKGVTDFREYFVTHSEEVLSLAQQVKIVAVNEATLKMYQAKSEKELYRGLNVIFNKESYDIFREELIALAEGKTEFYSKAVNLTLKGEERNILIKVVVLQGYEHTLSNVFVYIIDISELTQLELNLKESEEKYRTIVETAHDAILVVDTETGIIIEANRQAEELLGISANNIIGMHFTQLHPREEADSYRRLFQHHVKEGRATSKNLQVLHSCGDRIPVSVSSSGITLKGKKCISAIFRQKEQNESINIDQSIAERPSQLLSRRECEILKLIASGKSTKQIAQQMYISETTVGTHRMRIMQKLNMHKTADLVRYAMQSGLLDEHPAL